MQETKQRLRRGLVKEKQSSLFCVQIDGQDILCVARKNLKKDGVFVGDKVWIDSDNAICKIDKRKNLLVRPPVANIDKMFIVLAPVPKPDLYTVDKLILFCFLNKIKPVVCINKNDLDAKLCKNLEKIYKNVTKTLVFSSFDESVQKILKEISGVCVLAGQSAVGKSSIINALAKSQVTKVDTFSKKIERGKQTTRVVTLYQFGKDAYLADTAGFSKLSETLLDIDARDIKNFYPEFVEFSKGCKYSSCLHLKDENCGVVKAQKEGKIAESRLENYQKLYEIQKNIKRY